MISTSVDTFVLDEDDILNDTIYYWRNNQYLSISKSEELTQHQGYFILAKAPGKIYFDSLLLIENEVSIILEDSGWSMIGSSVNSTIVDPNNIISSNLYHFTNGSYYKMDTLDMVAFNSYLLETSTGGIITLQATSADLTASDIQGDADDSITFSEIYNISLFSWKNTSNYTESKISVGYSNNDLSISQISLKEEPISINGPQIRIYKYIDQKYYPFQNYKIDLNSINGEYPWTEEIYIQTFPADGDPTDINISINNDATDLNITATISVGKFNIENGVVTWKGDYYAIPDFGSDGSLVDYTIPNSSTIYISESSIRTYYGALNLDFFNDVIKLILVIK